jgi:hypothetical protein
LPFYRLTEDEYVAARNSYIDKVMTENPLPTTPAHPSGASHLSASDEWMGEHLWFGYGGAWQFNEIVGYLRVHIVGTQVRAEYWRVRAKRIVRTRNKIFEHKYHKLVPETELPVGAGNAAIYSAILKHIEACREALRPRYLDTSALEQLGPYVDWSRLINAA